MCRWRESGSDDTHGKEAAKAKAIELSGWNYPKHLAGRLFSLVVHGDAEGVIEVKRALFDWLTSMDLESAGPTAELSRCIGYWKPYATSHEELDRDQNLQEEVKIAADIDYRAKSQARGQLT